MCDPANDAAVLRLRSAQAPSAQAARRHVSASGQRRPRCGPRMRAPRRRGSTRLRDADAADRARAPARHLPLEPRRLRPACARARRLSALQPVASSAARRNSAHRWSRPPAIVSGEPVITDNAEAEDAARRSRRCISASRPADRAARRRFRLPRHRRHAAPAAQRARHGADRNRSAVRDLRSRPSAVGGHMKTTIALGWGRRAVVSPHIGDLDGPRSLRVCSNKSIADLQALYRVKAERIVCDAHPGYASTRWALAQDLPVHARPASRRACLRTGRRISRHRGEWLVFAWDGIGLGSDGDLWGGEALLGAAGLLAARRQHAAVPPAGGDRAAREPWRSAARAMWEAGHSWMPAVDGAPRSRRRPGRSASAPRGLPRSDACSMRPRRSCSALTWRASKAKGR